jgi:hypothetical protein
MGDWGTVFPTGQRAFDAGALTASSTGTTVTASATANTKGSWAQLIASTTFATSWMVVCCGGNSGATSGLLDIGVGAAAAEYVVVPDLLFYPSLAGFGNWLGLPCTIGSGVRLSARFSNTTGSTTTTVSLVLVGS